METLDGSRCFEHSSYFVKERQSERRNEWWQVKSSGGRDLCFFCDGQSESVGTVSLSAQTAIDAVKLPASRQQSTGSLWNWWDVLFHSCLRLKARKGAKYSSALLLE